MFSLPTDPQISTGPCPGLGSTAKLPLAVSWKVAVPSYSSIALTRSRCALWFGDSSWATSRWTHHTWRVRWAPRTQHQATEGRSSCEILVLGPLNLNRVRQQQRLPLCYGNIWFNSELRQLLMPHIHVSVGHKRTKVLFSCSIINLLNVQMHKIINYKFKLPLSVWSKLVPTFYYLIVGQLRPWRNDLHETD